MPDDATRPLATDAEIEAALAEAESQAARIPDLGDGRPQVVPIPVEPQVRPGPFTVRRFTGPSVVVPQQAEPREAPPAAARSARSKRIGAAVYRAIDAALWALNRPFAWLSDEARRLVGLLALVTIVVSLLALLTLPAVAPRRDALTQLEQQARQARAALDAAGRGAGN